MRVLIAQARPSSALAFQAHLVDGSGARVALDRAGDIVAAKIVAVAVGDWLAADRAAAIAAVVAELQAQLVAGGLPAVQAALLALSGQPRCDHHAEQHGEIPDPQPRTRRRRRRLAVPATVDHAQPEPRAPQNHVERAR